MTRKRIASSLAGMGALLCLVLTAAHAAEKPAYLRINAPADTVIFIELRDNHLRVASAADELAGAPAFRPNKLTRDSATFSGIAMPIPAQAIHPRCEGVKADIEFFGISRGSAMAAVRVGITIRDEAHAPWTYWLSSVSGTSAAPNRGKAITIPALSALKVTMTAQARGRQVLVAVVPKAGEANIANIEKAGKGVAVEVTIRDQAGKIVSSKHLPLSELGFG